MDRKYTLRSSWGKSSFRPANNPGMNFPGWLTMPTNLGCSVVVEGTGNWTTALVFSESTRTPWASTLCPRNLILPWENSHCYTFIIRPAFLIRNRTARTRTSCSIWFLPWISMSSLRQITLSRPFKTADMVRWKISGTELISKGSVSFLVRSFISVDSERWLESLVTYRKVFTRSWAGLLLSSETIL